MEFHDARRAVSVELTRAQFAATIDHTALRPETTGADVERLCREALENGFATACVAPVWVSLAARLLEDSPSRVTSVIGFPHGDTLSHVKAYEARSALDSGARELDMAISLGAMRSGDHGAVRRDIDAVVGVARQYPGILVKVILETSALSPDEQIVGCRLAEECGADFVKTSTGFGAGGATVEGVARLAAAVGGRLGVKAAGGIRTLPAALALLAAGARRLGCSSSAELMKGWRNSGSGAVTLIK
jgi:deoxyribose-phosphate aldolase